MTKAERNAAVCAAYRTSCGKAVARQFGLNPRTVKAIVQREGCSGVKRALRAERDAAIVAMRCDATIAVVASHFGLSKDMVRLIVRRAA